LKESALQNGVAIHAFVLMTNHVHFLVTPCDETALAKMLQTLGRRYVQYYNHKYGRTATLWEGRYRSTLVHLLAAVLVQSARTVLLMADRGRGKQKDWLAQLKQRRPDMRLRWPRSRRAWFGR
jgi:tRNA(Met) C34 N-acetyltransferase TmcA